MRRRRMRFLVLPHSPSDHSINRRALCQAGQLLRQDDRAADLEPQADACGKRGVRDVAGVFSGVEQALQVLGNPIREVLHEVFVGVFRHDVLLWVERG